MLNYLWPVFTVCLSSIVLKEALSAPKLAALLLSFVGVIIIMLPSGSGMRSASGSTAGCFCCILAAALYAIFNVMNKKRGGSQMINMFIYIGTGSVLAFLCCAKNGIALPTAAQLPGLSSLLSALLLHEPVSPASVAGLALILGGFFLQMFLEGSKTSKSPDLH